MSDSMRAEHGKILIPAGEDTWTMTIEDALEFADRIQRLCVTAADQIVAIQLACYEGHDWHTGSNSWNREQKTVGYYCQRDGCEGEKTETGWLAFEEKPHPWNIFNQGQCTGPGCYNCGLDAMEKAFELPVIGFRRGGIQFPVTDQMESAFREAQQ